MKQRSFYAKVYKVVQQIPRGRVATYGQIAQLAGSPHAFRAVGTAMKMNKDTNNIPCHRVVGAGGDMHGYSSGEGIRTKIRKLKQEGVVFAGNKVVLEKSKWPKEHL